jgi:hypothetical protein
MKIFTKLVAFLLIFFTFSFSSDSSPYKFHTIFIYNFTRYIHWPAEYQSGDFVIGVLGESEIQPYLEEMAQRKKMRERSFQVHRMDLNASLQKCHILFVPQAQSEQLDEVLAKLKGNATLVITEKPGMCQKGSMINFISIGGRWKFELNKEALEKAKLKVSSELVRFAVPIS